MIPHPSERIKVLKVKSLPVWWSLDSEWMPIDFVGERTRLLSALRELGHKAPNWERGYYGLCFSSSWPARSRLKTATFSETILPGEHRPFRALKLLAGMESICPGKDR